MSFTKFLSASSLAIVAMSGAAFAGGYVAPVEPAPIIEAPVVPPVADWAGGYAGGSLGYSFGADDEIGIRDGGVMDPALGDVEVSGVTAGLHAGYRWQRDNWVFGPELWVEGGSVDDTATIAEGVDVTSEVNYLVGLQLKTGYVVNPQTLVYGTVGYVRGDFDYSIGDQTEGYTADGYSLGLGVERKIRDNLAVFAEWQYRNFGKENVDFGDGLSTNATPEHHNVKVGVNFSF